MEESAGGPPTARGGGPTLGATANEGRGAGGGGDKTVEVELRRRPGEGFGFVIASQELEGCKCYYYHACTVIIFHVHYKSIILYNIFKWSFKFL